MAASSLKAVPDTNVLLAAELNPGPRSANREFFRRWKADEFEVLFSADTLLEYVKKLREKALPGSRIKLLLRAFLELGTEIYIEYYHLPSYPVDADDVAFLLCAHNGGATHLVTYDRHLVELNHQTTFRICATSEFLQDLKRTLAAGG